MVYCKGHSKPGFTLAEIMIAIVIIGIIGAVGVPYLVRKLAEAKESATKQTLKNVKNAIIMFEGHTGSYPKSLMDLIRRPSGDIAEYWKGPYLEGKRPPKDGWNKILIYKDVPDGDYPFTLFSYGPTGKRGKKSERISAWSK